MADQTARKWYLKKRFLAALLAAGLIIAQALGAPVAPTIAKLVPIVLSVLPDEEATPLPTPEPGALLNQGDDPDGANVMDDYRDRLERGANDGAALDEFRARLENAPSPQPLSQGEARGEGK